MLPRTKRLRGAGFSYRNILEKERNGRGRCFYNHLPPSKLYCRKNHATAKMEASHRLGAFLWLLCIPWLGTQFSVGRIQSPVGICMTFPRLHADMRPAELPMSLDFDEWSKIL